MDIPYIATAEDIDLKDRDGKPTARFFTISYTAEGVKRQEDRPITFFFNGGPGSSSVFLHLGFVGPKRIDIPSEPHTIRSAGDIRKCHGNTTCRADRYRELTVGLTTRSR